MIARIRPFVIYIAMVGIILAIVTIPVRPEVVPYLSLSRVSNDQSSVPVPFPPFEMKLSITETELSANDVDIIRSLTNDSILTKMERQYGGDFRMDFLVMDNLKVVHTEWKQGRRAEERNDELRSRKIPHGRGLRSSSYTVIRMSGGFTYFYVPFGYSPPSSSEITDVFLASARSEDLIQELSVFGGSFEKITKISTSVVSTENPTSSPSVNMITNVPTMTTSVPSTIISLTPSSSPSLSIPLVSNGDGTAEVAQLTALENPLPPESTSMPLIIGISSVLITLGICAFVLFSKKKSRRPDNDSEEEKDKTSNLFGRDSLKRYSFNINDLLSFSSDMMSSSSKRDDDDTTVSTPPPRIDDEFAEYNQPATLHKDVLLQNPDADNFFGKNIHTVARMKDYDVRKTKIKKGRSVLEDSLFRAVDVNPIFSINDIGSMSEAESVDLSFAPDETWDPDDTDSTSYCREKNFRNLDDDIKLLAADAKNGDKFCYKKDMVDSSTGVSFPPQIV